MNDIGLPNIMMTQAPQPQSQPNAELSSRRTGPQALKREDSSSTAKRKAFSDLVEEKTSETSSDVEDRKSSEASEKSFSSADKKFADKASGDESLKPISIDRSRRNDEDSQSSEGPSATDAYLGTKSEKSKSSDKTQAPENKKTKALKDFMAGMQQHFGIKPEQILQAFAKLSPQELMQSPQDVTAQVLKNLNLSEDQKPLASLMYQQMLAQTADVKVQPLAAGGASISPASLLKQKDVASGFVPQGSADETEKAGEVAKSELMSKLQMLKNEGPKAPALDVKAETKLGEDAATDNKLSDLQKLVQELKQAAPNADPKDLAAVMQKLQTLAPAVATQVQGSQKEGSSEVDARVSALAQMMGAAVASSTTAAQTPALANMNAKAEGLQAQSQIASNTDAAASLMPTLTALMSKFAGGGDKNSSGEGGKGQKDMKAFDALQGSAQAGGKADAGDVFAALTQQGAQSANASHTGQAAAQPGQPIAAGDLAATINEIISKSQVLVKKGGGEMKIEMKSESMGPVNMKVAVENGQVSVSMVTQNDKAKKALEENMHELKTALASHKLELGDIKVALSEGAHKRQDHNSADQQARQESRESASQFLGNMHDEREQNRGGFFDQPAFRPYSQNPLNRASMGPAKEVSASAMNNFHQTRSIGRAGNSGRLSMVA